MNLVKLAISSVLSTALALVAATAFAAVDVNKATQAELQSIKGIGPAMSTKILDARKTAGFKDWSDLQTRVKGVGVNNSQRFSTEGLTVSGAAYKMATVTDASVRPTQVAPGAKAATVATKAK